MKHTPILIPILIAALALGSCIPENNPPVVVIESPTDDGTYAYGQDMEIRVEATDGDGTVDDLWIYLDEEGIASMEGFPYTYILGTEELETGAHTIRVVATDNDRDEGEATVGFNLEAGEPVVETLVPSVIAQDSAVVGGRILSEGGGHISAVGISWGTDPNDVANFSGATSVLKDNVFSVTLRQLEYTTYYALAFAENESGRSYGNMISFATQAPENRRPYCVILSPFNGTTVRYGEEIELGLEVSDPDGEIARVLYYMDELGLGVLNTFPFNVSIATDDMDMGLHEIKAEAYDDNGAMTADSITIMLRANAPVLETLPVASISSDGAVVGGRILDDGGTTITSTGILWSDRPISEGNYNEVSTSLVDDEFTTELSGLEYKTYYLAPFAENSAGRAYGEEVSFSTLISENMFIDQRDGRAYEWVRIGSQIWMAENLAWMPELNNPYNHSAEDPFYYVYSYYGISEEEAMETANYADYGVLYNFIAAQEACPEGWYLPSMSDVDELLTHQGGVIEALVEEGADHWYTNSTGTNISGFSARGGGYNELGSNDKMSFEDQRYYTGWWTTDTCSSEVALPFTIEKIVSFDLDREKCMPVETGYSIRCLKR